MSPRHWSKTLSKSWIPSPASMPHPRRQWMRVLNRRKRSMRTRVPPLSTYRFATALSSDRKSTRLNSSHQIISYAVFCLKKKTNNRVLHRVDEVVAVSNAGADFTRQEFEVEGSLFCSGIAVPPRPDGIRGRIFLRWLGVS